MVPRRFSCGELLFLLNGMDGISSINRELEKSYRAVGERNSEPTKVGGIIVARAVRPSFATKI